MIRRRDGADWASYAAAHVSAGIVASSFTKDIAPSSGVDELRSRKSRAECAVGAAPTPANAQGRRRQPSHLCQQRI